MSNEKINSVKTPNHSITPNLNHYDTRTRVEFNGSCFKQDKVTYTHKDVVSIYIVYALGACSSHSDDPTIKNCLFATVKLSKNVDIDKHGYSGHGTGFDRKSNFSFPGGGFGLNVIIVGADMSSSVHIGNKKKDILILRKGPTQGLEHTLTAEKIYSINFTVKRKKFGLNLHYNGANSYLFVDGKEIHKFKAKEYEIVATPLCIGKVSKDWSAVNKKRNWIKWVCLWF